MSARARLSSFALRFGIKKAAMGSLSAAQFLIDAMLQSTTDGVMEGDISMYATVDTITGLYHSVLTVGNKTWLSYTTYDTYDEARWVIETFVAEEIPGILQRAGVQGYIRPYGT